MTRVVIFIVDGLGPDFVVEEDAPFMYNLMQEQGRELDSILAYSLGIYASVWTSTYPRDHEIWCLIGKKRNATKKKLRNRVLSKFPESISLPANYAFSFLGSDMIPTVSAKYQHLFEKMKYNSGDYGNLNGKTSIFDVIKDSHYERIDDVSKIKLEKRKTKLEVLYITEFDKNLHKYMDKKDKIKKVLQRIDSKAKEVYDFYKDEDDLHFIVFSDHGQAIIKERVDVRKEIQSLGLKEGFDYLAFYDTTMARFWSVTEDAKRKIASKLNSLQYGKLLSKADLVKYGLDFKTDKYGDLIFILDEGQEVFHSHYHSLLGDIVASHGYMPECRSMKGIFTYTGSKKMKEENVRILDITPSVLEILNTPKIETMKGETIWK